MGEAKRRGTYKERKVSAIERDKNKPLPKPRVISDGKGLAEFLTILGMAGGYSPFRIRK